MPLFARCRRLGSRRRCFQARNGTDPRRRGKGRQQGRQHSLRWAGNEAQQSGWSYGKKRVDHWKYKAEKPLFTIDASNVDKYADKLSAGQIAMIKQVKGYRMDIYPSHRDCGVPDFVAENTKKNVGKAKLDADGWSLKEATVPGFPFPIPASGTEAMWNGKMRYHGIGIDYKNVVTAVSPRKGGSEWIKAVSDQTMYFPWGAKGSNSLSKLPPVEFYTYFAYNSPTALAGQALSITLFLNQPSTETFYYFPGPAARAAHAVVRLRFAADRLREPVHAR